MEPDKNMKLADLMYGHGDKFMGHLSGHVDFDKYSNAPPIQICEMKCGCWIVVDGNNRVGLFLKENPEATIDDMPRSVLATFQFGNWDSEMMDWRNPCAKSFGDVMSKRGKKTPEPKNAIYGVIERHERKRFFACTLSLWTIDMFRCESILLRTFWVMVVMDVFTSRIIGFGVAPIHIDGISVACSITPPLAIPCRNASAAQRRSAVSLSSLVSESACT